MDFPNELDNIYCFKLEENVDAAKIVRYKIDKLTKLSDSRYDASYVFPGNYIGSPMTKCYTKMSKIGRFVDGKLFTACPDFDKAAELIEDALLEKEKTLLDKVTKVHTTLNKLRASTD